MDRSNGALSAGGINTSLSKNIVPKEKTNLVHIKQTLSSKLHRGGMD